MRLHHVQVSCPVGGEAAARRFYRDALGCTEIAKPAALAGRGGVWFRTSGDAGVGGGSRAGGVAGLEVHVGVEADFRPARKAHPALLCESVDSLTDLAERVAAAGFPVRWDADLPGFRRFYTADGNGNRVELLAVA